jgi:hypothetical protein
MGEESMDRYNKLTSETRALDGCLKTLGGLNPR